MGHARGMHLQGKVPTSYGSQDPTRKGGSDEGEEKPKKRACEGLSMEGGIFWAMSMPFDGEY